MSKSSIVTDTVNLLEQLSLCWNDFTAKCQSLTGFTDNQANVLSKRTKNKCQEIYYSNNVCMMQSTLGVLVVIAMLKEGFNFVGTEHWK